MSDDVRAAAERAVRWYESMRRYGGRWDALADDIVQSARAVLAEHPADDAEPVSGDRLALIGMTVTSDGRYAESKHTGFTFRVCRFTDRWVVVASGEAGTLQWGVGTMGDVLRLRRAIVVTLPEGGAG